MCVGAAGGMARRLLRRLRVGRGLAAQVGACALGVRAGAQEPRVAVELQHVEDLLLRLDDTHDKLLTFVYVTLPLIRAT